MITSISLIERPTGVLTRTAVTVLLTSFVAATYGFGMYLFAQLVPDMRADLHFDYSAVGAITAAAQCGFLAFAIVGGWLAPIVGGGRVVIGSVALCAVCLLLLPMTSDIWAVGTLLTIMGGAAASVYVPIVEIVARVIHYEHRGKVLGLVSSGTSYGVFLNSLLVPVFIAGKDWRGLWSTVGIITLIIGLTGFVTFWRSGLLQPKATGVVKAGTKVSTQKASGRRVPVAPWIAMVWLMTFLNGFSTLPFQNYLSPYLREELGLSVAFAARVWGVIGIIGMIAGFVVGWLSDKTGIRFALLLTYCWVTAAAMILAIAPTGVLPLVAGVLFALAFYPIFGLIPAYVSKVTDGQTATRIFAIANVTLGIGGILGNYAAGELKNATGTFVYIYVAVAVVTTTLGILAWLLPSEKSRIEATRPQYSSSVFGQ